MAISDRRIRTKSKDKKSLSLPNFRFEKKLWRSGYKIIAGCDEVGRGCFAGPVVASACAFVSNYNIKFPISNENGEKIIINDSKKLTALQREKASYWIKKNALAWGVGIGTVAEINKKGISKSTNSAFRRAVSGVRQKLNGRVDYLLIDAFYIPYVRGLRIGIKNDYRQRKNPKTFTEKSRQMAIIDGDVKSVSIAAASIIAKVYRDKLMVKLAKKHKVYAWEQNKGYGTDQHREAIKKHGQTRYHRKQFVETYLNNSVSSQAR